MFAMNIPENTENAVENNEVIETAEETTETAECVLSCAAAKKTSIGGQAVIEGVMMRGVDKSALSVRLQNGEIDTEVWNNKRYKIAKFPFVRGVFNFITSLTQGYKTLMKSAEKAGFEEESSAFDKKMEKIFGDKFYKIITVIASVIGVALALLLFMFLPAWIASFTSNFVPEAFRSIVEGVIKIIIFILYVYLTSKLSDIKRVYQYHGAEHKTIACYEAGEMLTPENVAKHRRFHPRCGTSFLLIVLIVSIVIFSLPFVTWDNLFLRVAIKVALLPLITGIAYEIIKLAGRHDNFITRIISAPGIWLQRITTSEPDKSQIEVAIASMKAVIPNDESDVW